jgi:hypothetical protein
MNVAVEDETSDVSTAVCSGLVLMKVDVELTTGAGEPVS